MRDIKESEYGLALSEAVGHMNHLYKQGKICRKLDNEGAYLWYKAQKQILENLISLKQNLINKMGSVQ